MIGIAGVLYGVYFVLVGLHGNAPELLTDIQQEGQFLYWIVVLLVLAGLWQVDTGEEFTKPLIVLIIIGFLLHNNNYQQIAMNGKAILPGTPAAA